MLSNIANVDFPWDKMTSYREICKEYSEQTGGDIINVSIGTPVDDVPNSIQRALSESANTPGYPQTIGDIELRNSILSWLREVRGITEINESNIVPTVGSKEAVAFLSLMLGVHKGDIIVRPKFAYPTYDIGAIAAGAEVIETDDISVWAGNPRVKVVWMNYPNNPTGECVSAEYMRQIVDEARKVGAIIASDECYALCDWRDNYEKTTPHISVLNNEVCGGDFSNIIMLYSLSKQCNMAGYRAAFIAGDPALVTNLKKVRKQVGLILPQPIQHAMAVALDDRMATNEQTQKYRARHKILKEGLERAGYNIKHSEGSLYVWVKSKQGTGWDELRRLAKIGILVAPGEFYDASGIDYVRISVTATDQHIDELVRRINE